MVKFSRSVFVFITTLLAAITHTYCYPEYGGGGGYSEEGPKKVSAAVMSKSSVKTVPVMGSSGGGGGATVVDIMGGGGGKLVLRFNSDAGGNIESVQKASGGGAGKTQKQSVMAEPDILIQEVKKPVIQKVRLQITPIRKVMQEVKPVQEQVETIIAKGMDDMGSKYPPMPPMLPKY